MVVALAASVLSCGREITGPDARLSGPLDFRPVFPAALRAAGRPIASIVEFDRVRIVIRRSDGSVAAARTVEMHPDSAAMEVAVSVPLSPGAPETGETVQLSLYYIDLAGDTVFTGGPVAVQAVPAGSSAQPQPVDVPVTYTGPGEEAVRITLSPATATITAGQTQAFTTQAFDAFDTPVTAPALFESTDTSVVVVDEDGVATARSVRASAYVIAKLYSGEADTAAVNVVLPASQIALTSGSAQSGPAGTVLAQNVVVRVTASDAVPVAGVNVTFAAQNGGAPGAAVVATDANGFASTTWTLGNVTGAQTLTATAAGLTGSPVTFTATATAAVPSSLVFTTQPNSATAGAGITPAVVVEARTTGGTLAVGYTDSVSLSIGANPASGTLAGTRTVAAVNGVATFPGLSIDRAGVGYTLVAASGALTGATSSAFSITPGAAAALEWTQQPAGGSPGLTLLPAPAVRAVDAFGNPAAFAGNVTVAIGANPSGATLGGTTTRATVASAAAFDDLTISASGVGYTLVASAAGLTSATSGAFNIGAATISWSNPAGGSWGVAGNWNLGRVPEASDVVEISLAGTYTVSLVGAPTIAGLVLGGGSGAQTLAISGGGLFIVGDIEVNTEGILRLSGSSITGSGTVVNDGAIELSSGTINIPLDNQGTLTASGASALTSTFVNQSSAAVFIGQIDGCCGSANLTVVNGFTNEGTIELTNLTVAGPYGAQLTVSNGTLVNAPGAAIWARGGTTPGGTRILAAQLDNQGAVLLRTALTINRANSAHVNSGVIDIDTNTLTLTQSGSPSSFSTTGNVAMSVGGMFTATSGTVTYGGGILGGAGTVVLTSVNLTLDAPYSNTNINLFLNGSTVNGASTLTGVAGRQIVQQASTVNTPFVNEGLLVISGSSTVNGTFTTTAASRVAVAQSDGCCSTAQLTFANGFTNLGIIELSNGFTSPFGAQLIVTAGTLVNAPGATIRSIGGLTPGGSRVLAAQLDNQGTVTLEVPLTINRANSAHVNSGTIDITVADLTLTQSGGPASFTNTGAMPIGAGRTFAVNGGVFDQTAGTLGGAGTLALASTTVNLGTPLSNALMTVTTTATTVNGPSTFTNAAGRTLALFSSTVNAPFVNDGELLATGSSALNGAVTQSTGAMIRVAQLDGCCGTATLAVLNGFTNNGTIELSNSTTQPYAAQLIVTNGVLVNAPSGTIASLGGQTPGGSRLLQAQLDNQGTISIQQPTAWNRANSAHLNSGTIDVLGADLTISQSGGPATFTNTGAFNVGAGRTLSVIGGSFAQQAGTFGGAGTVSLSSMTISFSTPFTNATTALVLASATINGPATVTNAAGRTLVLNSVTMNAPLVNDGTLLATASSFINGTYASSPASVIRVAQLDGCCSTASLTFASGFTNNGVIEISNQTTQPYAAQLEVTTGTLVNAAGSTIAALGGQTPGGTRTLNAQLDNQGTLTADVPLVMNRANSAHVNNGTIDLTGGSLTVTQSGGPNSFTNAGSILVSAGRAFVVSGGSFSQLASGLITGAGGLTLTGVTSNFADATPAVNAISLTGGTATFAQAMSSAASLWTLNGATVNSPATFSNPGGQTLVLNGATINAPIDNQGTLVATSTSAINGALTNGTGATLRVSQIDGSTGSATLTVANGFTNQGLIEITNGFNQPYGAQLNVTAGFLVNQTGATIAVLGGQTPGGARVLNAPLNNQGALIVGTPFSLNAPSADHVSSGTIDATAANMIVTQSGTTPTFTNSGSITLATGRIFQVVGGVYIGDVTGTITGAGNFLLTNGIGNMNGAMPAIDGFSVSNSTVSVNTAYNTSTSALALVNSTVNGTGSITNAATRTLLLDGATIQVPLTNQGTIHAAGATQVNAPMTTATTSSIRIGQFNGAASTASMTFANAWTNNGTIELTTAFATPYNARLAVTTGQFVNSATGTILTSDGLAAGGTREIVSPGGVNNQGTMRVGAGTAGRLTITAPFQSSGTLDLEVGGLTIATQYDHLQIVGSATLTGTLRITSINGFTPLVGQSFTPITYTSGGGTFSVIDFPSELVDPPTVSGTAVTVVGTTP